MGGDLVARALAFAERKHAGQVRKDGSTAYVEHPKAVMAIVRDEFGITDAEVLAAALLHDTIEDTTTDYDDLAARFGERVAGWVAVLTKDKRLPEERREREYFAGLAKGPIEAGYCKIGDSLHNLRDSGPGQRTGALKKARKLLEIYEGVGELRDALEVLRGEVELRS